MLVCGSSLILLLILNLLNHSFVTSSQNATRPRFHPSGRMEDYYDQFEDISTTLPSSSPTHSEDSESNQCLDMCVEQQVNCIDLALATGCLCPGLLGSQTPPESPRLVKVSQEEGIGVVVHWCAPTSIVTHYIVRVTGKDKVMERKLQVVDWKRSAALGDVEDGAHICVEAVNNAGVSQQAIQACTMFEAQTSDSGLPLKLGIIGGVVGLLMVLILALLLWRHKKRQKSAARAEIRSKAVL